MPEPRAANFNAQREVDEQDGSEFKFGALSQPGLVSIPLEEREQWLPQGELQFGAEDFVDCASRSPTASMECQFSYGYQKKIFSEANRNWLRSQGYVDDNGWITFSDRFTAILSGTTREGNSLKAPISSISSNGMIPKKMLPAGMTMTFDQYHNPQSITQEMRDLGKEFVKRFTITYEQVQSQHFAEASKDDLIGCALAAWPAAVNGIYPPNNEPFNHAVAIFKPRYFVVDNYGENGDNTDFIKQLDPNYTFFQWGYRIFISGEKKGANSEEEVMISYLQQLLNALMAWWQSKQPPTPSVVPPKPVILPTVNPATALYDKAYASRYKDLSKNAPDELGCAESLSRVIRMIYPDFPVILSTTGLNLKLLNSYHFAAVTTPMKGCVTIFPTRGSIIGHAGVWGKTHVMSNNSGGKDKGKWTANYTHAAWLAEAKKRGLPVFHYLPITQPLGRVGAEITTKSQPFMDQTIISSIVIVIAMVLSFFNVNYAGDLTQLVTAVVTIGAAIMAWYQRTTLVKSNNNIGDVNAFGAAR